MTGLLLYQHGHFVQVLEGTKALVFGLLEVIKEDARHTNVQVVIEQEITTREFGDWRMGFAEVDFNDVDNLKGVSNFFETEATLEEIHAQESKARAFLKLFQSLV